MGLRWRTGSFEESFPALATVTKHYCDLPLVKIEQIVQDELSRSGESVEAFGLKVPADALRQWGTLIVLAIQVYFSRHLRFMRRIHMDGVKEAKSAWIGLYDDKVSQYGTLVTAVVLPFVACVLLLGFSAVLDYQSNRLQWTTCGFGVLGLCASGYLACYTRHELSGLWSAMAQHVKGER